MAIDRTGRNRLRNALIGYMQMQITSDPFSWCVDDFAWRQIPDHSLDVVAQLLWNSYSDYSDHYILHERERVQELLADPWPKTDDDKKLRRQKEWWLFLCRAQAFLRTDLEIGPVLKKCGMKKLWKQHAAFFPFASPEQAESFSDKWLEFDPPFDRSMMAAEFAKAQPKPSWLSRILDFKLWG